MKLSITLIESGDSFIANCSELDINCYASDKNEAIERMINVLAFYLESARELGLSCADIEGISIDGMGDDHRKGARLYHESSPAIN